MNYAPSFASKFFKCVLLEKKKKPNVGLNESLMSESVQTSKTQKLFNTVMGGSRGELGGRSQ